MIAQTENLTIQSCIDSLNLYEEEILPYMPSNFSLNFLYMVKCLCRVAKILQIPVERGYVEYARKHVLCYSDDFRVNVNLHSKNYDFSREGTLLHIARMHCEDWSVMADRENHDFIDTIIVNMNANRFNPRDWIGLLFHYLLDLSEKNHKIKALFEGVVEERPCPMTEDSSWFGETETNCCHQFLEELTR